jgi:hypothetical protein
MVTEGKDRDSKEEEGKDPPVITDIPSTGTIESVKLDIPSRQQVIIGPVPLERHYDIFKNVEGKVKERLGELDHEYYLTGLRVAYDLLDSSNEPDVLPFSVEFGYLEWLEVSLKCGEQEEYSEEELKRLTQNAAIPIDLLDQLFESAKDALEQAALADLSVGVFIGLNGSGNQGAAATCNCRSGANRRRLDSVYLRNRRRQVPVCRGRDCPPRPQ